MREHPFPNEKASISVLSRRLSLTFATLAGASLVLAGCGSSVLELETGECLSSEDLQEDEVGNVTTIDCSEPHDVEVFGKHDLPDGEFPGVEQVTATAEEECGEKFMDFIDEEGLDSGVQYSFMYPTQETWDDADDRTVLCMAVSPEPVTGSMVG